MDLLLYLGLALIGFAIFWFCYNLFLQNEDQNALSWATGDKPKESESGIINFSRPLVHQLTLKYAQKIKNEKWRENAEEKLLTAGLSEELNVDEFFGLKMLWGILFPAIVVLLNFTLELGYPTPVLVMISPLGFMLPDFHANSHKKKRYQSVIVDLPFFIELLALSTQAGADFFGAIQKITDKADDSVLADEFEMVLRDLQLGSSREQALKDMSRRLDVPEVTSFVNVLVDADATGASIVNVLKDHSEQMRVERFVRAEKAGARASQAILVPMIMCIVPAVFIVMLGPVALQFIYGGG